MASSNRHWPSMFKSKPCNSHHQWQHDINSTHISSCQRTPYASGSEERSPDPKPRWNPKPEQIRILEAIFNSGMVNPPRDEIRRIRVQLQEYGQVGDANVFYWFQNRKSRSKHKQKHLNTSKPHTHSSTSDIVHLPDQVIGPCTGLLLSELLNQSASKKEEEEKLKMRQQLSYTLSSPTNPATTATTTTTTTGTTTTTMNTAITTTSGLVSINMNHVQGVGESRGIAPAAAAKSTVYINNVAFEVSLGPFNVREAFGDDAVLMNSTGQPVLTNQWGVTLQSLQPGAFYYLLCTSNMFA